jgi:hypothetical protein
LAGVVVLTAAIGLASAPAAAASQYTLTIGPAGAMEYLAINARGDILGLGAEPGAVRKVAVFELIP